MFSHRLKIRLSDTDATGVLFFAAQFHLAMQTLEAFLEYRGFPLSELLQSAHLFPVVHAEADYQQPLYVGQALRIDLSLEKLGSSSITLGYALIRESDGEQMGSVRVVHVLVDKQTRKKTVLTARIKTIFSEEHLRRLATQDT